VSSGLLTARGQGDERCYEFIHRSFAEFLTAQVIAMLVDGLPKGNTASGAQWETALGDITWSDVLSLRLWFQREWDEIVVYVGCLAKSDNYITWLLNQTPDPVLHALTVAARITEQLPDRPITREVENAVLEKLTPKTMLLIPAATREHLLKVPGHRLTEQLIKWAKNDSDGDVRQEAIRALAGREGKTVLDTLLEWAQNDSDSDVRQAAIEALAGREGEAVLGVLLKWAENDSDSFVRWAAIEALAGREGTELARALPDFKDRLEREGQETTISTQDVIELVNVLASGVLSRSNLDGTTRRDLFKSLGQLWEIAWSE
jgi:hypothetical protein